MLCKAEFFNIAFFTSSLCKILIIPRRILQFIIFNLNALRSWCDHKTLIIFCRLLNWNAWIKKYYISPSRDRLWISFFPAMGYSRKLNGNIRIYLFSSQKQNISPFFLWDWTMNKPTYTDTLKPLFRKKRFTLNKMFQRNASKFAIFYV